ncbi:metallophosphoesterase [Streptomyces tropicalis]|uniref:Metallophosphoesterase n=1 Tax=Streptomyces tropicalis TaxID=3034234 RepID=A0ABT6A689_9ACTN|nr:metallophosphoesterase [Streptomyces tropicalis]MDF3300164.1 metallophosphoesterase [Streptomyces tropicalis]
MRNWRRAASVAVSLSALSFALTDQSATADSGSSPFSFAVIGDIPYGDSQIADFPNVIRQINADPDVRFVDHLGDIKNGSTVCSDAYFQKIKSDFDTFEDPLVYTVGDNEWTDCHRPNNGSYNPLERLAAIRKVFFPQPDRTLGRNSVRVTSQADQGYPEDVRYTRADVAFAALHIVGSNNSMAPWTGNTSATPEQAAEVVGRTAAVVQEIRDTFAAAEHDRNKSVVLLTQADMFDPTVTDPSYADNYAFQPIVKAIAEESAGFHGSVYLFNGDSHVYNSDKPLDTGSKWLSFYGVKTAAPNLTRVTIDGSTNVDDWLKVTVDPGSKQVLSWTRVPFAPAQ